MTMVVPVNEKRSQIMRSVRRYNTKPEMMIRSELHKRGFRFRASDKKLPGTPDIVLPKWKTVIFVHGCFWHRHQGCRYATIPKHNADFWRLKFDTNIKRDIKNQREVEKMGWKCIIVWECETKTSFEVNMTKIINNIVSS